jgi:HlyD family secretion protein
MNSKIPTFLLRHKLIALTGLIFVLGGSYLIVRNFTNNTAAVKYTTAVVEKGTLVVSVSGSGQVAVSDQMDIKPEVSGKLTNLTVAKDQYVKKGQLLATIDSTNAEKTVRDAKTATADAEYDLTQTQKDYQSIESDAQDTLNEAYGDGYDTVSTVFFKLSGYVDDLKDVLGTENSAQEYVTGYELILGRNSAFVTTLLADYEAADNLFQENFSFFRTVSRNAESATIYQLVDNVLTTARAISQALDSARHMYDATSLYDYSHLKSIASEITTMQPKIQSDVSGVYSNVSSLQSIKKTIDDTVETTPDKIESAKRAVTTAENTLIKKQEALADAKMYAPFSGVIASLGDADEGDTVSSNTTLATLITTQKIAKINLNEVDVAKVKIGQKATITFDALDDLTVTGKIIEVDTLGTTNQGVVDYGVQISLDTADQTIKPGMTLSVEIITDLKQDVLMVNNSAVKKQGNDYYVKMAADLTNALIQIGLANDTMTEINSGLSEGDIIVIQTNNSSTKTSTTGSQTPARSGEMNMMQLMR